MEYGLGVDKEGNKKVGNSFGLNPYCSGIWSRRVIDKWGKVHKTEVS